MNHSIPSPVEQRSTTRRRFTGAVAILAALGLAAVPIATGTQAQAAPNDLSEAQAQVLRSDLLKAPLANLGYILTGNPSNPGPGSNAFDVSLLANESIDLGGVELPLFGPGGLINLDGLGALNSYSESPTAIASRASAGVIGRDGAIAAGPNAGVGADPAYFDLTQVLEQLNISDLTKQVLDQARLEIGALASSAKQEKTEVTSQYTIAGINLKLRSPMLAELTGTLKTALDQAVAPINDLVSGSGALGQLLDTVKNTIAGGSIPGVSTLRVDSSTVTLEGLDTAVQTATQGLLGSPLSTPSGSVLVDLSTGTISVDLAKLVKESGGGDLNSLPPNTELLSDTLIEAVLSGITEALQSITTKIADSLTEALNNVKVTMVFGVSAGCVTVLGVETCVAKGNVTVTGSLADFSGVSGKSPAISTTLAAAGIDFGSGIANLIKPVLDNAISSTTGPLIKTAIASVTDQLPTVVGSVTGPVLDTLRPVLEQVLARVANVTINEQPTKAPLNGVADLGTDSFTVRALSLTLLPNNGRGPATKFSLASSTVRVTEAGVGTADSNANANSAANANAAAASAANANANSAANANAATSANSAANANAAAASAANANANSAANANANGASSGAGYSTSALAVTGSNNPAPFLIGAAALLLLGAVLLIGAKARRNTAGSPSSEL
ncbi:MAG: choice-of-anchor G family protein [Renibacterium sp.]|nr:choice-of-anchor G family protein [Renibacterium sp.]